MKTQSDQCTSDELLQQLLLGKFSREQSVPLEEHILGCRRCGDRLAEIKAEDTLVEAARSQATLAGFRGDAQMQQLMDRLCHLPMPTMQLALGQTPAVVSGLDELRKYLAPAESPGELGRVGNYRVLCVLGTGGMGIVLEAEDTQLGRRVALKLMRPGLAASPAAKTRFLREARAAAAIQHDNVVTIHHVGEHEGIPYLAMQLLSGESLGRRLATQGRLSPAETVRIGREIAQGLAAAHARDVVHRDIKPDNIWLEAGGDRVKILDFGLAHVADDLPRLTQSGSVTGTPAYMAPEQIENVTVGHRADLFSLGCVLYECLTGQPAFGRATVAATLLAISQHKPPSPRQLNSQVSQPLSDLVMRLLEKDPARRPRDAATVLAALAAIPESEPSPARTGRERGRRISFAIISSIALIGAIAAVVISIKTAGGTLELEVNQPDVRVTIDGESIKLRSPRDTINVQVGRHDLEVSKDGFKTFTKAFEVSRGGKVEVSARLETNDARSSGFSPQSAAELDKAPPKDVATKGISVKPQAGSATLAKANIISFDSSAAAIDWLRQNVKSGAASPLVDDVQAFDKKLKQEGRGFYFYIGHGLMKSKRLTIVAAHGGRYFACECRTDGDIGDVSAISVGGQKNAPREANDAKLLDASIEGAADFDPTKHVNGLVKVQALCNKQAEYGFRLTCWSVITVQPLDWTASKDRGIEPLTLRELPQEKIERDGPVLAFVELCRFPKGDDGEYVIVSDPLPVLLNVRRPKKD